MEIETDLIEIDLTEETGEVIEMIEDFLEKMVLNQMIFALTAKVQDIGKNNFFYFYIFIKKFFFS